MIQKIINNINAKLIIDIINAMNLKINQKIAFILFICFLVAISFYVRIKGLSDNHPFWIDEFSSADQSKFLWNYGFSVFKNPLKYFEHHNVTTYFLIGASFKLFGFTEFAARIPSVIIGSLVPLIIFVLTDSIFGIAPAIGASLLTAFSYFEITWSRQARGYILLQAITLLTLFLYYKVIDEKNKSLVLKLLFVLFVLLGILTHTFFIVFILSLTINYLLFNRKDIFGIVKNIWFYVVCIFFLLLFYYLGALNAIVGNIQFVLSNPVNNLWYYHSFLWREYGLITFLGLTGLLLGLAKNTRKLMPIVIYVFLHLFFISFAWTHYISKYTLPIFPFLLIGMSYSLCRIAELFAKSEICNQYLNRLRLQDEKVLVSGSLGILFVLFILINGDKFVIKPKSYYSVNHNFREIAILDYSKIYGLIKQKGKLKEEKTAIIDTWPGRVYWYIDENYQPLYILRWKNEKISVIGQKIQRTAFITNKDGEKIVPRNNNLRLLEDAEDLKRIMKKYPRGFLYIDDESLPIDVRDFATQHLKKELYLDHYPLDDNPYSIWPATLYSWGV